jgi:hypothetical protein
MAASPWRRARGRATRAEPEEAEAGGGEPAEGEEGTGQRSGWARRKRLLVRHRRPRVLPRPLHVLATLDADDAVLVRIGSSAAAAHGKRLIHLSFSRPCASRARSSTIASRSISGPSLINSDLMCTRVHRAWIVYPAAPGAPGERAYVRLQSSPWLFPSAARIVHGNR